MPFTQYYGQFQGLRGNFGGIPPWARGFLALATVPGLLVILAAGLLLVVGIVLIILLVFPVYRLVRIISPGRSTAAEPSPTPDDLSSHGRKAVESRIV